MYSNTVMIATLLTRSTVSLPGHVRFNQPLDSCSTLYSNIRTTQAGETQVRPTASQHNHKIPKHFAFSKYTFGKRENVRLGQSPTGTQMVSFRGLFNGACRRH